MKEQIEGQAEEKPFKFEEPLTDNADGNLEPSMSQDDKACVETRRRVCIKCEGEIPSNKYSNAKYCSDKCRNAYISYRWAVSKGKFKKPGVGSGNNQEIGPNHPTYTTGIGSYSKRAFEHYGRQCNRCGTTDKLLTHHKDEDRTHNELDNLEVLCKSCHQEHHALRNELGRYTKE